MKKIIILYGLVYILYQKLKGKPPALVGMVRKITINFSYA
uniref:Uncharacterized protein n=1 Tax=Bacillus thuringiensis subsp. israelensis TaxID=1430 RepID=Q8KNW5_BACTI|nr:hypothetical protein [Bacillus thuringiensis serovar israelensis]CAD30075.1 hypothetical protein [Bacillus thuringiensis serovar israelensis]